MKKHSKYLVRNDLPQHIQKELGIYPPLQQKLLFYRGIETQKDANSFLNPNYDTQTHDPFLLHNMKRAVTRILSAIKKNEKITIYSDYDCDGIPGGVILHDFFKKIEYANFENYIPHRNKEGYGLNVDAVEKIAKEKTKVLITVDCGTTDFEPIALAKKLGIDVIVTDHHLPGDTLPDVYTLINPKQKEDLYPYDALCGAGLAFKLVQALVSQEKFEIHNGWEKWLLDMAGVATIADMVPLTGENRVLAHFGLTVLRKSRRAGLQQLCRIMRVNQQYISEDDIGFMIAPRINAASRMDKPEDAFMCLATTDEVEAGVLAKHLHSINNQRKGIVAGMIKEIKKRIEARENIQEVFVMGNPEWKPSLVGLAANTFVDSLQRPVFLWGRDENGIIKGSCRAPEHHNLVELMASIPDFFIGFGGHHCSGGFSVSNDNIHHLEDMLVKAQKKNKTKSEVFPTPIDATLTLNDVSWNTYRSIEQCAPFGKENPKPLFLFKGITPQKIDLFGKEKNHLRLTFKQINGKPVSAIGFFMTAETFDTPLSEGGTINLIAVIEKSTFRNFPELRLRIVDIIKPLTQKV